MPARATAEIARLDEGLSAVSIAEIAPEHCRVGGGGVAGRAAAGCWVNRVENLGMDGPITRDDVAAIIDWFAQRGLDATIKLCPYADDSAGRLTAEAGFVIRDFDQVLAREVSGDERWPEWPAGLVARVLDPRDHAEHVELARVQCEVFRGTAAADTPGGRADIEASVRCMERSRATTLAIYAGGVCVGGAGVERLGDLAGLYGAAIAPDFRRRGLQQALIAARLALAARSGARLATIATAPGGPTERNAARLGFAAAYTRVTLVRKHR